MGFKEKLSIIKRLIKMDWEGGDESLKERDQLETEINNFMLPGKTYLQWFFTKHCNLKCEYCSVIKSDRKDMSNEQRKDALKFLKKKFKPKVLNITGGEPTLKFDELVEFIAYARGLDIFTILSTNGLLLDNEKIEQLSKAGLRYICFSYDGIAPKDDGKVFEKMESAFLEGILPAIQPVFSTKNWDIRNEIFKKSEQYTNFLIPIYFLNPAIVQNIGKGYSTTTETSPPIKEVREFYTFLNQNKLKYRVKHSNSYLKYMSKNYGNPWHCKKFNWLTINNDGTLRHCNEFLSDYTIDDLANEYGLKDFNNFRKECAESCPGCYYECFYDSDGSLIKRVGIKDFVQIWMSLKLIQSYKTMGIFLDMFDKYFPDKIKKSEEMK